MKLWVLLVVLLLLIFFRLRLRFFFINYYFSFKIKISSSSSSLLLFIQMLVGISAYLWVTLFSAHDIAYSREYTSTKLTRDRGFSGSQHLVQVQELNFRPLAEGSIYFQILGQELRYTRMERCQAHKLVWPLGRLLLIMLHILII